MKLLAVIFVVALFAHASRADDEEVPVDTEEANAQSLIEEAEIDSLQAELGPLVGINPTVIHLPMGIESGPAWECLPRRLYRRECNFCRCNRNRRLICTSRNCDDFINL